MIIKRGRSLKYQLTFLCIGLLVPTVLFVGVLLWRFSVSERTRAEEEARGASYALSVTLDREIVGVLTTLQALATSPSLQAGNLPAFYEQINEVQRLQHIHISLRDTQGRVVVTTRAPIGTAVAVPPKLAEADQDVLRTGTAKVTDIFTSTTTAGPVFQVIAAPVRVHGTPTYLLGASLDPSYLADVFRRENLPPGWIGTLVDGKGIFVVRTQRQEDFVGKTVSADFRANATGQSGSYYGRNIAGVSSLVGYARSNLTGWTAAVNIATDLVSAPLRHSLYLLLGLGCCLGLLATAFALFVSRRIDSAILRLCDAADAIGQGRAVGTVDTTVAEVNRVGLALLAAEQTLHDRDRGRAAAEASVRESEAHLAGIFAQTGAGFAEAGTDGRFLVVNDHYCTLVGRSRAALLEMRLQDIPHPDDAEINAVLLRHVLDTGEPVTAEKRLVRGDGQIVWVTNTMSLIRTTGGKTTLLSVAIDISEQKRVELDLAAAKEAAEEANRAKSTFIANMSHELRTPLSAILGYSELLREDAEESGEQPEFVTDLGKIEVNARHLLGLINDVLDLSKIESGKMEVFTETLDVGSMVRDVAATVDTLVRKKNNTLVLDLAPDLGTMQSDLTKIRQVLLNLLSNASKFTDAGTITLSAMRDGGAPPGGLGDTIVFRVTDTGIGMTPQQVGKLFQRFTQADASTTRRFGGTGLGLSITKAFMTLLGGQIGVDSVAGEGTTVTVSLPVHAPDADGTAPSDAAQHGPATAGDHPPQDTVLVIDDDPAQRELMTRFLEREGFSARTASSGPEGLMLAQALRPRAILLDVTMPGMDGWTVLRALKADPDLTSTPVVMVTFIDDNGLATTLGAADHVTKPVKWEAFRQVMDRFRETEGDILVVDDNPDVRRHLRAALERDGWTVTEAANGRDALGKVSSARPKAVLLDLEMPVMDGFAFLHAFRALPGCDDIPVVVITARDLTRADREQLQGVNRVMTKGTDSMQAVSKELHAIAHGAASN